MAGIQGFYDMHLHCGPEPIPRKFDAVTLGKVCAEAGMAGIVAKSHFYSTVPMAAISNTYGAGNVWGSVTLNHYVGGLNPDAVRGSLGLNRDGVPLLRVVWMPTVHAAAHLQTQAAAGCSYDIPSEWTGGVPAAGRQPISAIEPITILDERVTPRLTEILDIIAANRIVLATGHLSREEVFYLVALAKQRGVEKIILTHPMYKTTRLTAEDCAKLTTQYEGVYAEQSYGLVLIDQLAMQEVVAYIKAVGPEKTILTTDLGQPKLVSPPEGMAQYIQALAEHGISPQDIFTMGCKLPQRLILE